MSTTNQEAYRIDDFVEFHNESCLADTIVEPMVKFLELSGMNSQELKEEAVLIYSLTYSVPTTIVILCKLNELNTNPKEFWQKYRSKLLFQSDRKYVKMNNRFINGYFDFKKSGIFELLRNKEIIDLSKTVKLIEQCYSFGRFSAFLFLETYGAMFNKEFVNNQLDWIDGATVTSGLLNVLGRDKEANIWDKTHQLDFNPLIFDKFANYLLDKVSIGKKLAILETNLCAYRKLFKGTRYIGYYSDRVLEELYYTIEQFPEHKKELEILFVAREMIIPDKYLGEKHGWTGIRTELKKHYLKTGDWRW